jgi:hypothetical protein
VSGDVSALIVPVPQADPIVGAFRAALDSGAALGVPAHVTVLYPFIPVAILDDDTIGQLRALFAGLGAFEFSLASIGWFDHQVVYLRPQPDAALRGMTRLVAERWPAWPPYGGMHADPTPHLTIGDNGDVVAMRRAAEAVSRHLPLRVEVSRVELYAGSEEPGSWSHHLTFDLGVHPT